MPFPTDLYIGYSPSFRLHPYIHKILHTERSRTGLTSVVGEKNVGPVPSASCNNEGRSSFGVVFVEKVFMLVKGVRF